MDFLGGLFCVVAAITVLVCAGHFTWVFIAWCFDAIFGTGDQRRRRQELTSRLNQPPDLIELESVRRQINLFVERQELDSATGARLLELVAQRERRLTGLPFGQVEPVPSANETQLTLLLADTGNLLPSGRQQACELYARLTSDQVATLVPARQYDLAQLLAAEGRTAESLQVFRGLLADHPSHPGYVQAAIEAAELAVNAECGEDAHHILTQLLQRPLPALARSRAEKLLQSAVALLQARATESAPAIEAPPVFLTPTVEPIPPAAFVAPGQRTEQVIVPVAESQRAPVVDAPAPMVAFHVPAFAEVKSSAEASTIEPSLANTAAQPLAPPEPTVPRRTFKEVLAAFMEERNIRWGELVGGLLIIGCSIALVLSLWETLAKIQYYQFLVFGGVTAALFGVGLYTHHRWRLASTSQGVLIIATLLVPLNFLVMAAFSTQGGSAWRIPLELVSLALFGWLLYRSSSVLAYAARWELALGVTATSAFTLLVARVLNDVASPSGATVLGLELLPVLCLAGAMGRNIWVGARAESVTRHEAAQNFTLLGSVVFAVLTTLGLLAFRARQLQVPLELVGVVVSLLALPAAVVGLVVGRRLAESESTADEDSPQDVDEPVRSGTSPGVYRLAGTTIALLAMATMIVGVACAWRQPLQIVIVGLLNYAALTFLAFRFRLPLVHGVAIACATVAYLAGFHVAWGTIPARHAVAHELWFALTSARSGTSLVGLFALLAIGSEWIARRRGSVDGGYYAGASGVVGLTSLALVTVNGYHSSEQAVRAMAVYGLYGVGGLVLNFRWRQAALSYASLGLSLAATLWGLWWWFAEVTSLWGALVSFEALLLALAALSLPRFGRLRREKPDSHDTALARVWLGNPLARVGHAAIWLALALAIAEGWQFANIVTAALLLISSLLLLSRDRHPLLAYLAGVLGAAFAVAAAARISHIGGERFFNTGLFVALASLVQAAVAVWAGRRRTELPSEDARDSVAAWYTALSRPWLHIAVVTSLLAMFVTMRSPLWLVTGYPIATGLVLVAAYAVLAWGYRSMEWTWVASAVLLVTFYYAGIVVFWAQTGVHTWPIVLLAHASVVTAVGLGAYALARQSPAREAFATLFGRPAVQTALASSAGAIVAAWLYSWGHPWPMACWFAWAAALWLLVATLANVPALFSAGQVVMSVAVVSAAIAWLDANMGSWTSPLTRWQDDPRAWQVHTVALGLSGIVWAAVRVSLRNREAANRLLNPRWPAMDRVLIVAVAFVQLQILAGNVLGGAALELLPQRTTAGDPFFGSLAVMADLAAGQTAAWAALVPLVAIGIALWDRWRTPQMLAAVALLVSLAWLGAGQFSTGVSTASAVRWILATAFLAIAVAVWCRQSLATTASALRACVEVGGYGPLLARGLLVAWLLLPVLGVTLLRSLVRMTGEMPAGPAAGFFFEMHPLVRQLTPMLLVLVGIVGFAARETSAGWAFSGGLVASFTAVGGYVLGVVRGGQGFGVAETVTSLELATLAASLWAIAWLASRPWVHAWRESTQSDWGRRLMNLQLAQSVLGNAIVLGLALFTLTFFHPDRELTLWASAAGSPWGWAALLTTLGGFALRATQTGRWPKAHSVGLVGMAMLGLIACTIQAWWPEWGYRALMLAWALYALAIVLATWYVTSIRTADELPAAFLPSVSLWVRAAAILATLLALKAAWWHAEQLWAATTIATAAIAGASMAVWRRREGWAFAAGLGANLAATLVVWHFLLARDIAAHEWWLYFIQSNLIASSAVALLWLAAQSRLYRLDHFGLLDRPLLGFQVGLTVASQAILLLAAAVALIAKPSAAPTWLVRVSNEPGALAVALSIAAAAWYVREMLPGNLLHVVAVGGLAIATLAACRTVPHDLFPNTSAWTAYHVLTLGAVTVTLLLLTAPAALSRWIEQVKWCSARDVIGWVTLIALLVTVLAIRGANGPSGPYWAAGAVCAMSVLLGAIAVWHGVHVYTSGLLVNVAASLLWWRLADHTPEAFLLTNTIALALAAVAWSLAGFGLNRFGRKLPAYAGSPPFPQAAAPAALLILAGIVAAALATDIGYGAVSVSPRLAWGAVAATAIALLLSGHAASFHYRGAAAYTFGLVVIGIALHTRQLSPRELGYSATWSLAAYALAATVAARLVLRRQQERQFPLANWFVSAQVLLITAAAALSVWVALDAAFDVLAHRLAGPLSVVLTAAATALLADRTAGGWSRGLRFAALALPALVLAEGGWAAWGVAVPEDSLFWLHAAAIAWVALVAVTLVHAFVTGRLAVPIEWTSANRQLLPVLSAIGIAALVGLLGQEIHLAIKLGGWYMASVPVFSVAAAIFLLACGWLAVAMLPAFDPLALSPKGRQAYVYGCEALLGLLYLHMKMTRPDLLKLYIFERYWMFIFMGIAFAGAAVSEWFERRRLTILAEPLRRTALLIPLAPTLGFWLLATPSPLVWFLVALFYGYQAVSRKSGAYGALAALTANIGVWVVWHQQQLAFLSHLQLWLIPVALAVLIAEQLNRDRLTAYQTTAVRYLAMSVIYVSSTADMFIAGLGREHWHLPLLLAFFSVVGILAGIVLRIRPFLFLGVTFLLLAITTLIWHAAVGLGQTWLWYVAGIVLGIAIIALFAVFEKRRNDVLAALDRFREWE